jgi:hypothetical protein
LAVSLLRQFLRRHGIRMTIPCKQNEYRTGSFDCTSTDSVNEWSG